jgi:hypothetical protein
VRRPAIQALYTIAVLDIADQGAAESQTAAQPLERVLRMFTAQNTGII